MSESTALDDQIREPFESYVGHEPYIFISYAHRDKEKVYPCLEFLNNQNINIWYDEGIPPSAEWVEEIAQAIKNPVYLSYLCLRMPWNQGMWLMK